MGREPGLVDLSLFEFGLWLWGLVQGITSYLGSRGSRLDGRLSGLVLILTSGIILQRSVPLPCGQFLESLCVFGPYPGACCTWPSFPRFDGRCVVLHHLSFGSVTQPLGNSLGVVTRRPPSHLARYLLEHPGGVGALAFSHARLEGLDLEFAGTEELLEIELSIVKGGVRRLAANVACIMELDAFLWPG